LSLQVITVLPNGEVISDEWTGRAEQKWTLVEHPRGNNNSKNEKSCVINKDP